MNGPIQDPSPELSSLGRMTGLLEPFFPQPGLSGHCFQEKLLRTDFHLVP